MRHEQEKCRVWFIVEQLELRQLLSVSTQFIFGGVEKDLDGDGEYGSPLSGVTVFIDADGDGALGSGELNVLTDDQGRFQFDDLPLGRYVVQHVVPDGLQLGWWNPSGEPWPHSIAGESFEIELTTDHPRGFVKLVEVPWVVIDGTNGPDVITVAPDAGGVLITVNGSSHVHSIAGMRGVLIRGRRGADNITFDSQLQIRGLIYGDWGQDVLKGGAARDRIFGGRGPDEILGRDGNDELNTGEGALGGSWYNHVVGGAGNDRLYDSGGHSTLEGNAGNDLLFSDFHERSIFIGGGGDDTLTALSGRSTLIAGDGADLIKASDHDMINGGRGSDVAILFEGEGEAGSIKGVEDIRSGKLSGGFGLF